MPVCGRKCEVWSRVVGYYRPVCEWNEGKQAEFLDRKPYKPPIFAHKRRQQRQQPFLGARARIFAFKTLGSRPGRHKLKFRGC